MDNLAQGIVLAVRIDRCGRDSRRMGSVQGRYDSGSFARGFEDPVRLLQLHPIRSKTATGSIQKRLRVPLSSLSGSNIATCITRRHRVPAP
jgi:hypothetical protein